jgi:hypothetical protein
MRSHLCSQAKMRSTTIAAQHLEPALASGSRTTRSRCPVPSWPGDRPAVRNRHQSRRCCAPLGKAAQPSDHLMAAADLALMRGHHQDQQQPKDFHGDVRLCPFTLCSV